MKLIVALASAVALLAAPASGDPTLAPLTIGALPTDGGSVVFYAKDLGYFERHGIDATVNTMSSGSAMSAAVVGGTLDIGNSNAATIAQARERGMPLRFIAPSSVAIPPPAMTDVIMVAGNSAIRAGSDANGKVFGVSALKNLTQIQA